MTYKMGVVGLGVMGASLARNIESKGFPAVGYDLDKKKTQAFLDGPAKGKAIAGADRPEQLMEMLERPRRVLMMVQAGRPVDSVIAHLHPAPRRRATSSSTAATRSSPTRIDATRRTRGQGLPLRRHRRLRRRGRRAASARRSCPAVRPKRGTRWRRSSRRSPPRSRTASPAATRWVRDGAGHYVKMVHNGIEYGDMQLICEAYNILHEAAGLTADELADVFADWNEGELDSLPDRDHRAASSSGSTTETGKPLVDVILDTAGRRAPASG